MRGFGDLMRWMYERARGNRPPLPDHYDLPVVPDAEAKYSAMKGNKVCWVGHPTLLLELGGSTILTDPIWSSRASPVPFAGSKREVPPAFAFDKLPEADLVLLSHDHYDHMDKPTIKRLGSRPHYVVPLKVGQRLKSWGISGFTELDWWEETEVAGLKITCIPAQHFSGRTMGDRFSTLWCGYVVETNGYRFLFAGDSGYFPGFQEMSQKLEPVNMAAIPIGAYLPRWFMQPVHMDPKEAIQALIDLQAKQMLAIHWGTFPLTDEPLDDPPRMLQKAVEAANIQQERVWAMKHGETRRL